MSQDVSKKERASSGLILSIFLSQKYTYVEVFKDIFRTILLQTEQKLKLSGTIPLGA
jgi:hypothetical protein